MRSFCTRSMFATSHQFNAFIKLGSKVTPKDSIYLGINVLGPQTFTVAPSFCSAKILDNATLE